MTDIHSDPGTTPPVRDRRTPPPGILPRHTQTLVLAGIAALMVGVIALSGRNSPKQREGAAPLHGTTVIDPNAARIQEYEKRIEEQTRKVQSEQAQLMRTQQALRGSTNGAEAASPMPYPVSGYSRMGEPRYPVAENPSDTAIQADRKKREYQSLFASNVALTLRKEGASETSGSGALATPRPVALPALSYAVPPEALGMTLPNLAQFSSQPGLPQTGVIQATPSPPKTPSSDSPGNGPRDPKGRERDSTLERAEGKRYRLFEGAVIETVLTNRLDGSFSGPVNCMVTTNVYSHNGQHVLIPQGSRVLGEVRRVETFGQQRLAVAFHRLIMPDGYSASLDQFHGLNQIGETGLVDQINHHYVQVFGVSLAIGAIAGLSQANTRYGVDESSLDAYRQGVATSLSQSSMRILDRYLNVLPTFTIREGHRVKIYLSDDLLLPAYDQHQMPGDL